jgi:hypothetical protein
MLEIFCNFVINNNTIKLTALYAGEVFLQAPMLKNII